MSRLSFSDLVNKTLKSIINVENEEIVMIDSDYNTYKLKHFQDCCESVYIESIVGDLSDLIGSPILSAEEVTEDGDRFDQMWTFYKLSTINGYVTIRFLGESEYYSVSVDFIKV